MLLIADRVLRQVEKPTEKLLVSHGSIIDHNAGK